MNARLIGLMMFGVGAVGLVVGLAEGRGSTLQAPRGVPAFEVDPSWPAKLPNGWVMGVPSWVAVDRRDHVGHSIGPGPYRHLNDRKPRRRFWSSTLGGTRARVGWAIRPV